MYLLLGKAIYARVVVARRDMNEDHFIIMLPLSKAQHAITVDLEYF